MYQIIKGISKEQLETLHDEKKRLYKSFINMARMNEHLFSFIRLIRCEYAVAVATTASGTNTYEILKEFNVADEFDYIITQEDVRNTKPDPECYELAVKLAEVNKADAVIFEDSETGLKAAEASGINYVRVYGYS